MLIIVTNPQRINISLQPLNTFKFFNSLFWFFTAHNLSITHATLIKVMYRRSRHLFTGNKLLKAIIHYLQHQTAGGQS